MYIRLSFLILKATIIYHINKQTKLKKKKKQKESQFKNFTLISN